MKILVNDSLIRYHLPQLNRFVTKEDVSQLPVYSTTGNPFIGEFIIKNRNSRAPEDSGPYLKEISAGKNTYVYDAHTYHTKVPPEGIEVLIRHYTRPNDIVFDPFCGSGMTGVAALRSGRKFILTDISPAATFIAYNYVTPIEANRYASAIDAVLELCKEEELRLYRTRCRSCGETVPMDYMVWSYKTRCYECDVEFVIWDVARDEKPRSRDSKVLSEFKCPNCKKLIAKRKLIRTSIVPVAVGYRCCKRGLQEAIVPPNQQDLTLLTEIEKSGVPRELWYPKDVLPLGDNTKQAISHGMDSVDKLYTVRALSALAKLWNLGKRWPNNDEKLKLMFTFTSLYHRVMRLSEFRFWGGSGNTPNYNVPMIMNEQNVFKAFSRKAKTIELYLKAMSDSEKVPFCISTQSSTNLNGLPSDSVDFIFTDPPYGGNINYSEMNFPWEAWLGTFTNTAKEAIMNSTQSKGIEQYEKLITEALRESYRVLKPGGYACITFHNSSNMVWSSIQQAVLNSRFVILDTNLFDKQHATFKQLVSEGTVGYDVIMHCKKYPKDERNPSRPPSNGAPDLDAFLQRTYFRNPALYKVNYMHVKRKEEVDFRRLYSEWLAAKVKKGESLTLDFVHFRNRAIAALSSQEPQASR